METEPWVNWPGEEKAHLTESSGTLTSGEPFLLMACKIQVTVTSQNQVSEFRGLSDKVLSCPTCLMVMDYHKR